jgi:hypothetical protein
MVELRTNGYGQPADTTIGRESTNNSSVELELQNGQVALAIHSHLSRQFVANYVAFFTMYAAFLVYFSNILLPRLSGDGEPNPWLLFLGVLVTLGAASGFLLRSAGFGAALQRIERDYLTLRTRDDRTINSQEWFEQLIEGRSTFFSLAPLKWFFHAHRQGSEQLAWIVILVSLVVSVLLLLRG